VIPSLVVGEAMARVGRGSIINISSMAAASAISGTLGYSVAKSGIDSFTRWLAMELARKHGDGIRVNAVAPGIIDTEIHARTGDPDRARRVAASIPLRRPGQAEEVAAAIAWLMSPDASYTTGAVLRVSGGR
jgi:glucose 1-dehydrogenase